MTAVVTNTKSGGSVLANAAQSLGFTGTAGRTMIVAVWGESSDTVTDVVDSVGGANNYVQDANVPLGGNGRYFYRCTNFTGSPTSITVQAPTDIGIYYAVWEVTGLAASSVLNVVAASTSTTATFTTTADNCIAFCMTGFGGDSGTISATGSTVLLPHNEYGRDAMHILDCGTAGAKTLTYNISSPASEFNLVAAYNIDSGPVGPTVSTITGTTATEGSAVVFTVTMSGTGGLTDAYSWSGTAGAADYTQTLTDGMFTTTGGSGSVIVSGGNIVVPSTVTEFTVTVPTTGDTLDEANETIRLVFGGVTASSGTITDDDATPAIIIPGPVTVDSGDSVVASYTLGAVSGRVTYARLVLTDGTAVGGTNYTNAITDLMLSDGVTISAGVLTIPAGVVSFTITIPTAA